MSDKRKKKNKNPTQGERLTNLEEKLQMLLDRMDIAGNLAHTNAGDTLQHLSTHMTGPTPGSRESSPSKHDGSNGRKSRPKERLTSQLEGREYTPKNRPRARTSTPHNNRHRSPRTSSCTPARNKARVDPSLYSTADILDSPSAKVKAQQILEILNPSNSHDKGKIFDPYLNKSARFSMPRLFLNISAQKMVKQQKHYDDLTLPQFIEGFVGMIDAEKSEQKKGYMLMHLGELGTMLQDFQWETVREWSNSVLSSIGEGLYTWRDGHKIEKEKVLKIMGANASGNSGLSQCKNACLAYNATRCHEPASHGHTFMHVCSFCLTAFNAENEHPVMACNKRMSFRRKDRSDFYRGDKGQRPDSSETPGPKYQQDSQQFNAGKGRGYQPQYKNQQSYRYNWNQPPPVQEAKNWTQPAH